MKRTETPRQSCGKGRRKGWPSLGSVRALRLLGGWFLCRLFFCLPLRLLLRPTRGGVSLTHPTISETGPSGTPKKTPSDLRRNSYSSTGTPTLGDPPKDSPHPGVFRGKKKAASASPASQRRTSGPAAPQPLGPPPPRCRWARLQRSPAMSVDMQVCCV